MIIHKGYKTELNPNNKQKTLLTKSAGCARFAYNWGLSIKKTAFDNKEKIPNSIELHKQLNKLKLTEFPWMYEVSKCSPQSALQNLDKSFDNFFRNCKQKKKGKKGFPKFKSKKNRIGSFTLTGQIHVLDKHVQLPRLGKIRLFEKDYLPKNCKILSATVSEHAGKWFVSILVEEEIPDVINKTENKVGVDLGIKILATISDGTTYENLNPLRQNLKKLKKLCKSLNRKKIGGKNRTKAGKKLAKLHYKIACIRKNLIHKITTKLTKTKSKIVIEDLNVSGMMQNRKLSKAIADVGFYEFRRQLTYKGLWHGCEIVLVNRFYPSSKKCSCCGHIKEDLTLKDRIYICDSCGLIIDRDLNAAINLLNAENTVSLTEIYTSGEESSGLGLTA